MCTKIKHFFSFVISRSCCYTHKCTVFFFFFLTLWKLVQKTSHDFPGFSFSIVGQEPTTGRKEWFPFPRFIAEHFFRKIHVRSETFPQIGPAAFKECLFLCCSSWQRIASSRFLPVPISRKTDEASKTKNRSTTVRWEAS